MEQDKRRLCDGKTPKPWADINTDDIYRISDTIDAGVLVLDCEGTVIYANRTACEAIELPREKIVGRAYNDPVWTLLDEDGSPLDPDDYPAICVLRKGKPHRDQVVRAIVSESGASRWIMVNSEPISDPETGRLYGAVATFSDLTPRKAAEDAINAILKGTSSTYGEGYFQSLVCELSNVLHTRHSFVGRLISGKEPIIRTIAFCENGKIGDNVEYLLSDTPCQNVVGHSIKFYSRGVQELFPESGILRVLEAESYLGTPLTGSDGRPLGLLVVINDGPMSESDLAKKLLTIFAARASVEIERMDAEKALQESEQKLDDIFRNVSELVFMVDVLPNGELRYGAMNPAVEEALHVSAEQARGKSPAEVLPPKMAKSVMEHYYECIRSGQPLRHEDVFDTPTGRRSWQTVLVPVRDDSGRINRIAGIARETTQQIELKKYEMRMQEVINSAPFGTLVYLLDESDHLVLLSANAAAGRILGLELNSYIGKTIEEAFPGLAGTDVPGIYRMIAAHGGKYDREQSHYHYNGISGTFEVFAFQPADRRVAVFFRDITDRKLVEEKQRQYEKNMEHQKRQFYRDTIFSVTSGKLSICDTADIEPYIRSAELKFDVLSPVDVAKARNIAEDYSYNHGLTGERLSMFMLGVGEAITNAIKHGHRGRLYAGRTEDEVWIGIADRGQGIESLLLPRVVLLRGYSTKPSLGLGYSIMLEVADNILLKTTRTGTTVILVKNVQEARHQINLSNLPDTWASLQS